MAAWAKFKAVVGLGSDSSQNQTGGTYVDDQPLTLQASQVCVDFKKIIGVGSLGTIYTGTFMGEKCAVKVFNSGIVQKEALQRLDIVSIIQHHPNVVLVHGLWYGSLANSLPNNDPALVMELCSNSLDTYLTEKVNKGEVSVFRLVEKLDILSAVTSGMMYLHSKRIVHGDLSAKNILLTFTGRYADIEILAKVAGVHEMKLFTPDTVLRLEASVQRSSIMPPEVKDGGEDVEPTESIDLFSFGCLIAHVASCVFPVPSTEAGLTEFQKRAQFISHHQHVFEPLMKRCLSEQPGARGTFEDVGKYLSVCQSKYGGKQAQKLEEQVQDMESRRAKTLVLESEVNRLKNNLQAEKDKLHSTEETAHRKEKELDHCRVALQAEKDKLHTTEKIIRQKENELEQCKKELDAIGKHSRTCELERDSLREEKRAWVKTEAGLRNRVKELEVFCTEMEQNRMVLLSELQDAKSTVIAAKTQQQADYQKISSLQDNLQAEKDKLHSTEETARKKEKELDRCRVALQAEKDKLHTTEKIIRQKENELEQCKNELAIAKARKRHQENAVMAELKGKLDQSEDQKAKLLEEKNDQKKRENALLDTLREFEKQHSALKRDLSMHQYERDKLKKEKADVLLLNQQMSLAVQQQTEEKKKALKDKEEHIKQHKDVETRLIRLSGNHVKKMAELNEKIRSLQDELMEDRKEREQLTVQETLTRKNEASEEQHRETTRLQEENSQLREERDSASKRVEELQRQLNELCKENESLSKAHTLDLQKKTDLSQQLTKYKQQMEANLAATAKQLDRASFELEALRKEKGSIEEHLEAMCQDLKSKQEELNTSATRLSEMDVQLKRERMEWASQRNSLQQEITRVKETAEGELKTASAALAKHRDLLSATDVKLKRLEKDLAHSRDEARAQLAEAQQEEAVKLESLKASKAVVEKDLSRARRMVKDLLDERVVVNAESEQKMENLNKRLMELKHQAALSEEHLGQVQGVKDEHHDLKLQLKKLTASLDNFQRHLTDEQKSRKSLDASVKALRDEIAQLRTELKERDNEVSSLAAANKHLRRKVDAADANIAKMQSEASSLKEQVKCVSEDNNKLKQTLDGAEAAIQRHKTDYEHSQEKLRESEQQVALFQGRRQQLELLESVSEELKTRLSGLMMIEDGASVRSSQEAAQKVQQLEAERDSYKAERHMYQMKCLDAEDLLEAMKNEKQSLEDERDSLQQAKETLEHEKKDVATMKTGLEEKLKVKQDDLKETQESLELSRQALREAKVYVRVTEQNLREEYKKKNSEAYEVIKRLLQDQGEGGAQHPPEKTKLAALMDICKYFREESTEALERAAEEKQSILASKKEADERVEEMACRIATLKECTELRDRKIKDLQAQLAPQQAMEGVLVPLASDVVEQTGDEALLQQLCYMATGIKQLLVSTDGGRFTLGSGDASLEFPPGAVVRETLVRYAIILHGPFVFSAGYKLGSVVVYLNMDGATLKKPVLLFLSHWCIMEEGDDEDTLKFLRAPHTLEAGQGKYVFEEQEEEEADFTTRTNVGVLTIQEPRCLHCVETKITTIARYSAVTFSKYISAEDTQYFMIQLMCDSLEWNKKLTCRLQHKKWEKTSSNDAVTRFQYADSQPRIVTARPRRVTGPGWEADIEGHHAVIEQDFLVPMGKSELELEQEVTNGRFPPCILCKIIYNSSEELRVKPAMLMVDVDGANVPLSFSCRIKEEMSTLPPVSPASSEPVFGAAMSPSPMDTAPVNSRDIITALNHRLDAKWRHFGTFLRVEYQVMEAIQRDKGGNPEDCMLDLLGKWTSNQAGMGTLARTWQTVVEAVQHCGDGVLAESMARKHGVNLLH